jgi:predicted Zn-ribbon and HTH transcriptional regulator
MARVPITVMGYRCERCGHEWVPRGLAEEEPRVCPKCRSPWWNRPRKSMMTYDDFRTKIVDALTEAHRPLTWTEIRTAAGLPQLFPNNQWVHRLEKDIGLLRNRDTGGIIHWQITNATAADASPAETAESTRPRSRRKQGVVE